MRKGLQSRGVLLSKGREETPETENEGIQKINNETTNAQQSKVNRAGSKLSVSVSSAYRQPGELPVTAGDGR